MTAAKRQSACRGGSLGYAPRRFRFALRGASPSPHPHTSCGCGGHGGAGPDMGGIDVSQRNEAKNKPTAFGIPNAVGLFFA